MICIFVVNVSLRKIVVIMREVGICIETKKYKFVISYYYFICWLVNNYY